MIPAWMAVAAVSLALPLRAENPVRAAAPVYSAASVVNSADYASGPLAPNSLATVFGAGLSFDTAQSAGIVKVLAGVRVVVGGYDAPLVYVSPGQINFVVPNRLRAGTMPFHVVREGITGPQIQVDLADAAPAIFRQPDPDPWVVATHADYRPVTPADPARPGEAVILYAAGLGATSPDLPVSGPPAGILWLKRFSDLRVLLDGVPLDPSSVLYAGVAPGWVGLYQVNVQLPSAASPDPELRLAIGEQRSAPGLKLPLR